MDWRSFFLFLSMLFYFCKRLGKDILVEDWKVTINRGLGSVSLVARCWFCQGDLVQWICKGNHPGQKRRAKVCGSWKRSCRDTASSKTLAQNSGDSCLERVFLISEKGQSLEILNFFGVCGSLSVVCPMTSVARCGQAILVCFDIADALNIALFLVTSQLLAGDLKTTKNPLYYWQTLIKYEHCDEFFTYYPKYNDYVAMQPVRDDTTSDKEFCVVEGDTYPPKFCSTFPPDFQKETLKLVIRDCKNTLCELAQSGKWKAGWFKQGKAKKMPWPREMQKDGHQSLGYEDAFPTQLFRDVVGLPILDGGLTWANQQSDGDIWGIIL